MSTDSLFDVKEKPKLVERALLLSVYLANETDKLDDFSELLDELEELVGNLGIGIVDKLLIKIRKVSSSYYLGKGKMEEIIEFAKERECDCIIFDNSLSPSQQRNLEKESGICVIDRQEVILDIFAQRAFTKEARLQVGLARMYYSLPRLKRMWSHLDRQAGGIGSKGEGETQLETDKRLARKKISKINTELAKVKTERTERQKRRRTSAVPNIAIIGYTNSGKSTLLNTLTDAGVLSENKLFATLDPTTRSLKLPNGQIILLTDTVGFIRNLPHQFIDSFKSTLEESIEADFILHVLDGSNKNIEKLYNTTLEVLEQMGAGDKDSLLVINKIDVFDKDLNKIRYLESLFPDSVFISAKEGTGFDSLLSRVSQYFSNHLSRFCILLPYSKSGLKSIIYECGRILSEDNENEGSKMEIIIPKDKKYHFEPYII